MGVLTETSTTDLYLKGDILDPTVQRQRMTKLSERLTRKYGDLYS